MFVKVGSRLYETAQQPSPVEETLAAYLDEVTLSTGQRVLISGDLPSGLVQAACQAQGWQVVESPTANQQFPLIIAYPSGRDGERQQEELLRQARSWVISGGQMLVALGSKHGWAGAKDLLNNLGKWEVLRNLTMPLEEIDRGQLKGWREALNGEPRIYRRNRFDGLAEDPRGYYHVVRIVAVKIE